MNRISGTTPNAFCLFPSFLHTKSMAWKPLIMAWPRQCSCSWWQSTSPTAPSLSFLVCLVSRVCTVVHATSVAISYGFADQVSSGTLTWPRTSTFHLFITWIPLSTILDFVEVTGTTAKLFTTHHWQYLRISPQLACLFDLKAALSHRPHILWSVLYDELIQPRLSLNHLPYRNVRLGWDWAEAQFVTESKNWAAGWAGKLCSANIL